MKSKTRHPDSTYKVDFYSSFSTSKKMKSLVYTFEILSSLISIIVIMLILFVFLIFSVLLTFNNITFITIVLVVSYFSSKFIPKTPLRCSCCNKFMTRNNNVVLFYQCDGCKLYIDTGMGGND